jgi:hypothetical protein
MDKFSIEEFPMPAAFPTVRIGNPLRYKSLSVFPLFSESEGSVDYLLADEAMRDNLLTVEEISESGSVPELLVENKGDTRVLFIEGEELVGAKQNRILNTSILIAAKTKTRIPVSCVEAGRWSSKSHFFAFSGSHTPSKLRYALKSSVTCAALADRGRRSDQGKVWAEVDGLQCAMAVGSSTAAMSDTFEQYEDVVKDFRDQLKYVDGASGMAVAVNDKVVGCDLFDKSETCRKVWDRLLSGLVFDALTSMDSESEPKAADVDELVEATKAAPWKSADPIGEGEEYRTAFGEGHQGSALMFADSLVHGSVMTAR